MNNCRRFSIHSYRTRYEWIIQLVGIFTIHSCSSVSEWIVNSNQSPRLNQYSTLMGHLLFPQNFNKATPNKISYKYLSMVGVFASLVPIRVDPGFVESTWWIKFESATDVTVTPNKQKIDFQMDWLCGIGEGFFKAHQIKKFSMHYL